VDADGDTDVDEDGPTTAANAVDASRTIASGTAVFDVSFNVQWGGTGICTGPTPDPLCYWGYEVQVGYNPAILQFVPTLDANGDGSVLDSWAYTNLGLASSIAVVAPQDTNGDTVADALYGGASRPTNTTSNQSGQAIVARFRCVGVGTSPLHLRDGPDGSSFPSRLLAAGGVELPTSLADASITCEAAEPTPTPTRTATPTPAPQVCEFVNSNASQPATLRITSFAGGEETWSFNGGPPNRRIQISEASGGIKHLPGNRILMVARTLDDPGSLVRVIGAGTCPSGPGAFLAIRLVKPLSVVLLKDRG